MEVNNRKEKRVLVRQKRTNGEGDYSRATMAVHSVARQHQRCHWRVTDCLTNLNELKQINTSNNKRT
jgi:hypothetical protein